jgi:hypothetical protein
MDGAIPQSDSWKSRAVADSLTDWEVMIEHVIWRRRVG